MLTYVAGPYSHDDPDVRQARFLAHCTAAANLMKQGDCVYSPIAHSHPIAELTGLEPMDHDFWMRPCRAILPLCDRVVVLKLDGWSESRGTKAEIEDATLLGIEIEYVEA